MSQRKLDTRACSPFIGVSTRREAFDRHLDTCETCQHRLCHDAEILWRTVVLAATRAYEASL